MKCHSAVCAPPSRPGHARPSVWYGLLRLAWGLVAALALSGQAAAQQASPHAIDIPRWFTESFLDFKDEVDDAAKAGKRVMVYFGQDGCPYCKALMQANFGAGAEAARITEKTRKHFVAIAVNIWGDREATWFDGKRSSEKALAKTLGVQFTPTLLFLDTEGGKPRVALRLNGYQPPERFTRVLDYVIEHREREISLADFMAPPSAATAVTPAVTQPRPYLMRDSHQLARRAGGKPLAVSFESAGCAPCDEMHREAFTRPALQPLLKQFDIARLVSGPPAALTTPDGQRSDTRRLARDLGIGLHPTVVFFDTQGREVFRFDGYLRPFHIESAFDYVASGAYRQEPQFQRYVQARAEKLQAAGRTIDLWR